MSEYDHRGWPVWSEFNPSRFQDEETKRIGRKELARSESRDALYAILLSGSYFFGNFFVVFDALEMFRKVNAR
jgi:hypothetical protein